MVEKGMRVVSTGGTALSIKQAGLSVVDLSEQTGFEEMMDGRVKSLHPRIYMPLLARLNHVDDNKILKKAGLSPFDLLVCNLYPFEEKQQSGELNLVEWIDVGGPALLRAAAKNFDRMTVLCDPADYKMILKEGGQIPSLEKRKQLAGKAFSLLAHYNFCIAEYLQKKPPIQEKDLYLKGHFFKPLRYGENPGQKANWFQVKEKGLHKALCLQGKELSFNNICDLNAAVSVVREFQEPCVTAIKHNNPCGVACDKKVEKALSLALQSDPVSVFGAILALNRPVSVESAQILCSLFLEAVIAPDYSAASLKIFKSRKNMRIIKWPELMIQEQNQTKIHCVDGGFLMQNNQNIKKEKESWKYIGQKPGFGCSV